MPVDGVYITPEGQKYFIPLENNPEVFTSLVHDLGVSSKLGFNDVYSVDDPGLLSFIPRPSHALIAIIPAAMYIDSRKEDAITMEVPIDKVTYEKTDGVVWYPQTIGNACGLIALIHCVANGATRGYVTKDSFLDGLLNETKPMKPRDRAAALYNSEELEKYHMRAAVRGNTSAPPAEDHPGHHFIAYVKGDDGHLWELEGGVDGPVDRGMLGEDDDVLSPRALEQGVKKFLKYAGDNMNFSLVALAESLD